MKLKSAKEKRSWSVNNCMKLIKNVAFTERSDFHMIDKLSIATHTFAVRMLTWLSIDVILLPRYLNSSTNIRGLPFILPSCVCVRATVWMNHLDANKMH